MSEINYKIGDRVRIKSLDWYNENKDKFGNIRYKKDGTVYPVYFSKYMSNFCGEILTIKSVFKNSYHMNETSSCEFWTDEMIEGLVDEPQEKMVSLDKVCSWIDDVDISKYLSCIFSGAVNISFISDDFIRDLKKAMEV